MKKNVFHYFPFRILAFSVAIVAVLCFVYFDTVNNHYKGINQSTFPEITPWEGIGGCAAGGSGTKNGAIRWIGEGTSSGLIGIRVMPSLNIKKLSRTFTINPRVSIKPNWNSEIGFTIPFKSAAAEVQFQSNIPQQNFYNSGIGDLTLDLSRTFGMSGEFKAHADITFPTGTYDEARGTDLSKSILPQILQMGQGVWSLTPALTYSRDFYNSMLILDASLYYPFIVRLDKNNEHLDSDYKTYYNETINRERFHYKHIVKPYGENDRGDYFPPVISIASDFVLRGVPGVTQSVQFTFNVPLGVQWSHSYNPALYDPHPDPDHRAWDALLAYGIEMRRLRIPLFFGIGMPIHDKKNSTENTYDETNFRKWDTPDWRSITEEMIITCGVTTSLF
jgi:hypothetical protein